MQRSRFAAERVRVRRQRAEDAELFQLLVDQAVAYAVIQLTPEGTVASWNQGAERLSGYAADEIVGEPVDQFYTAGDRQAGRPRELLEEAVKLGRIEAHGWQVRKDGSLFWADVAIMALDDSIGGLRGFAMVTHDRSEPLHATSELQQSEKRFSMLVENIKDYAIFMLSPEGTILTWNQGAQRLKGYAPREIIGHSFERFYTEPERLAGRPRRLLGIARAEGRVEDEGWRVRKDGSRFWANVVITSLWDQTGQLIGFAKVTRDLSERRAAEERLRQSEQRFTTLVDAVKDYAIFMLSPEGTILTWNQGAQRLKGYTPDEIIGQSFERFYTPEARAAGRPTHLLQIARNEGRVQDEGWRVRKDGSRFWADVVITALRDDTNHLLGFAKVTRDLTERRQAEQDRAARMAAERAAEEIERLQVATAALAAVSRPETAAEVLTDVAVRELGATAGAIGLPHADLELVGVHGRPFGLPIGEHSIPFDQPHPLTYACKRREPVFVHSRPHLESAFPELTSSTDHAAWAVVPLVLEERLIGVLGVSFEQARSLNPDERGFLLALAEVGAQALDRARLFAAEARARTEAEAAERLARDEAQLVETLHRVSLTLSAELDLDKVVHGATEAAMSATGAASGTFLYNTDGAEFQARFSGERVLRSDDIGQDERYAATGMSLGPLLGEQPVRSYLAVPVVSRSGEVLGGFFLGHDRAGVFSERAERLALGIAAQTAIAMDNARLYHDVQQAVETRDEFLAAAAHDLKTPLASTKAIAQLLRNRVERMQLPGGDRLTDGLARIDQSVMRMTALIDELLDLGRMQMGRPLDLERAPTDIVCLIQAVVTEHQPNAPRHTFRLSASDETIVGNWDAVRLRRALDNLVSNAIKYSPDGGDVVVHAEKQMVADKPEVVVQVTDHGVGIPADDLPFIFERFRRGGNVALIHGTGIGLGIAQSLVQLHGGTINADSTEGTGTTFTVRLPLD